MISELLGFDPLQALTMLLRGPLTGSQQLLSVEGEEAINELYRFTMRVAVDPRDDLLLEGAMLGRRADFAFATREARRNVYGIIEGVEAEVSTVQGRSVYRLHLGPQASSLTRRQHCRVFQDQSVVDVVTTLLGEHQVAYRTRLVTAYPKRAYSVQYHETDFAFVQRLLSEVGIFFYFDHPGQEGDPNATGMGGSEILVLSDTAQYYPPVDGAPELLVRETSAGTDALHLSEQHAMDFSFQRRPGTVVRLERAYDFQRPPVDLSDTARASEMGDRHFVYAFSGQGDESPPEYELARVRLEQDRRLTAHGRARTVNRRLMPGRTFLLREHPIPTLDGPYVVTRVRHNAYAAGFAPTHMPMYSNEIEVIPSNVPARPPAPSRVLRQVTETATVVGPADSEIHADALGRIKVQFHWDLQGQRDDKSSAWVRVAHTLAGASWGSQFIPRVGMEVLVTFLGGDLDRPVVTHALYNATHPPPFALPGEKTKSGLRTRSTPHATGFHEVSFDDDAGKELMFIHAQRDATRVVEHDDAERVGNSQRVDIGVDRETKIGRRDHTVVGEEQTSAVAGSGTGTGMKRDSILLTTGGATLALAGSDAALTANGDLLLQAGGTATLKAPTVIVEAGIVQINGESVITIVSGGPVTVKGANVDIKGATITEN